MIWALLKKFPKVFLVFGVLVTSTVLFCGWWFTRSVNKAIAEKPVEDIAPKIAQVEANPGHFLLVDNDLYDAEDGGIIFKDWLQGGMPQQLFFDPKSKKVIARYERGFVRYGLDGHEEARLLPQYPPAFSSDLKSALYIKDKDIWRADIDWDAFKFVNEKKLTSIEQFNDAFFAANILLQTDKTLIVRNMNRLLRVNLETGDVKPVQVPLNDLAGRRSPDNKSLVGFQNGQFYCYDVDSDTAKTVQVGRGAFNGYLWLDNDRCLAIAASKVVVLYDRAANTLSEVAQLPFPCSKLGEPSPDGKFVFCVGRGNGALVDVEKKTATPVTGGAGLRWISNDTFAFAREVPDSSLRGTWLQTVGQNERQVSPEPYLVGRDGGWIVALPASTIVFATKHGLSKIAPDKTAVVEMATLPSPPDHALGIQQWAVTN